MSLLTTDNKNGFSIPIVINSKDPFSPNNHNMYRIIIVKSGSGIVNINNTSFVFTAPGILCLNEKDEIFLEKGISVDAEAIYYLPNTIDNEFSIDALNNNVDKLRELSSLNLFLLHPFLCRTDSYKGLISVTYKSYSRLNSLCNLLRDETTNFNNYWRCRSRSLFLEILFLIQYLCTEYYNGVTLPHISASSEINDILLYLHTNYTEKITVNELAQEYCTNRTTLSQKFISETGFTIKQYLIKIRINISSMLLRDTLLPIAEIAHRVGFKDTTHFTRTFQKHLDMLPSKYREKTSQF